MKTIMNKMLVGAFALLMAVGMWNVPAFAFVEEDINAESEEISVIDEDEKDEDDADDETDSDPLTPDGNANLVDDSNSKNKQFLTVTTRNGNYFYLIIDRDDSGNETVHFLNQVDESDLLSLMDKDEIDEYQALTGGDQEEETTEVEETTEAQPEEEKVPEKEHNFAGLKALGALAFLLLCGGAGGAYFYVNKKKNSVVNDVDPDADYDEDEIYGDADADEGDEFGDDSQDFEDEFDVEEMDEAVDEEPDYHADSEFQEE